MSQTLRIELVAPGAQVARDIRQTTQAMNQMANAQRRLGGGRSAGPQGAFVRLWHSNNAMGIRNNMSLAQAQAMQLQHNHARAQSQANRAMDINFGGQGVGFGRRLNTWLRSTRFGNGVSPLIGRTMDLFGGGGQGMGAAAGGAAAAVAALAAACKVARERLEDLAGARNFGGGSIASANRASRIGAVVGVSGSEMGQLAQSVIGSIAEGGPSATYAMRYGVRAVPGIGDPSNKMDRFIRLIQGIANDPNEEMARKSAQQLGLEQFLGLRDLSPETRSRIFNRMKNGPDQADVRAAAEFNAQLKLMGDSFRNIVTKFASPFIRFLTIVMEKISKAVDYVAETYGKGHAMQPPQVAQAIEEAEKRAKNAVDKNTDAINRNTDAINAAAGMYGGGERARGAVPKSWSNTEFQRRYMKAQAAALGAFGF